MTYKSSIIILCLLFAGIRAFAQVTVAVITRTPMPASLAEWQRDRSLFQVLLFNPAGSPEYRDARISFSLKEAGGSRVIAQSLDKSAALPRFTIPAGASTVIRSGQDIFNEQSTSIDQSVRASVVATNNIPEGNYEFCVRIYDSQDKEIGSAGEICRLVSVIIPDPPSLIQPANGETLTFGSIPLFSWTPVQTAGRAVKYSIRVSPIFDGQNARAAIDNNPALFEKSGLIGVSLQYVQPNPQFSLYPEAIGFAWQIQALDANGRPASRNDGKSEIFVFKLGNRITDNEDAAKFGGNSASGNIGASGNQMSNRSSNNTNTTGFSSNASFSSVEIGEFTLNLDVAATCKNECAINGSGKIYVGVLHDSIAVQFAGLGIRRSVLGFKAVSGEIVAQLPHSKRLSCDAAELEITTLRWTPENASYNGSLSIDWPALGLGGGKSVARIESGDIKLDEIPAQSYYITMTRNGREIGFGDCLALSFDSVIYGVNSSNVFAGALSGEAVLPCLIANGDVVRARFGLQLGKTDAANLLVSMHIAASNVSLPGTPFSLNAENILLDLSSEANFTKIEASNSCFYAESRTNPLWRGIIIPNGQISLPTDDKPLTFIVKNAILEPELNGLALSVKAQNYQRQNIKLKGFRLALDTAAIEICRQNIQYSELSGLVFLPEAFKLTDGASNFDKLRVRLTADERWNWRGTITADEPARLKFGKYGEAVFVSGALTLPVTGKSVMEWGGASLAPEGGESPISLAGLKFVADGEVYFGENGWKRIETATRITPSGLPIIASEIGFGYDQNGWWHGASGVAEIPEESGLSAKGGIVIRKLKVAGDKKLTLASEAVFQKLSVSNKLDLSGKFRIGEIQGQGFGLICQADATFHLFGGVKLPVEFVLGKSDAHLYWHATGSAVFSNPPSFSQSLLLFGGAFGAGWNVDFSGCDSSAVEHVSMILAPVVKISPAPLSIRAGLLLGESSRKLVRIAATVLCASGAAPGTLANYLEIGGNAVVHPEIGFASGHIAGQMTSLGAPIKLNGIGGITLAGKIFQDVGFSIESRTDAPSVSFDGINGRITLFEKFTAGGKNAQSSALQITAQNGALAVSQNEAVFSGTFAPLIAAGGQSKDGTSGYVIAEDESAARLRLLFSQDKYTAISNLSAAANIEGNALVGFDALPCAGALSVAAVGELSAQHRRKNGEWDIQPQIVSNSCGAAAINANAALNAACSHITRSEIKEIRLQAAENQTEEIIFPEWSEQLAADPVQVKITAKFNDKIWEFEQSPPAFSGLDELSALRSGNVEQCDAEAFIDDNHYAIRNAGSDKILKGSRFAVNLIVKQDGKNINSSIVLELARDLFPGAEYSIELNNTIKQKNKKINAVLTIRTIAPLVDINSQNNCAKIGAMTCPK